MRSGGTPVYVFKPWIPTYAFWLGVIQLVGLNLLGIAWLIWSKKMELDPKYQPKWMFRTHLFLVGAHVLILLIATYVLCADPGAMVNLRVYGAKVAELPIWVAPPSILVLLGLFAAGLHGIRKEWRFTVGP